MPSTYTTNNGIELIATGEQSGTWGGTTNTNLELLDTALDGQVSVTLGATGSSGSPNTLPVTDGAASNGRNRLVIFADGGDLGGTAFVQLTPNNAEKIVYVRNNLSGSRSILLFQGTYSASDDYEIPAGKTAVVFFDGAGSGAVAANIFNNAHFDAINVVGNVVVGGDIDVDGTTNLDVVDIDGAVDMASTLTVAGVVDITDTTDASDATGDTGALRTEGGASIAKKLFTGDGITTSTAAGDSNFPLTAYHPTGTAARTIARFQSNVGSTGATVASITAGGKIIATELDVSGAIDVDAVTHLDVVNIDGSVDMAETLTLAGNADFNGTLDVSGKITANVSVAVKNGSTSAGFIEFFEDSNNGTNKVTLIGPASTADITLTLPNAAGTIATADDVTALAIALG